MKKFVGNIKKQQHGQILVIMALIFIGLVAIIGLAVDTGYVYVSYSRLRRAVDAAGLSATMQYKKNVTADTLQAAAREFLILNGIPDSETLAASVDTCDTAPGDPVLCTTPARKFVRVTARENVPLFFLSVIGLSSVPIEVTTISEAATIDVVLVIDRSESMGVYKPDLVTEYGYGTINRDPAVCNDAHPANTPDGSAPSLWTGDCHPFPEVKAAALSFVNEFMDPGYDRVAIVVFDNEAYPVNFGTVDAPVYFSSDQDQIRTAIRGLWMYDGFRAGQSSETRQPDQYYEYQDIGGVWTKVALKGHACAYRYGAVPPGDRPLPDVNEPPCRFLNTGDGFYTIDCYGRWNNFLYGTPDNFTDGKCGSTNIGRGLWWAASIFNTESREESLLVTILLTDGTPNAGYDDHDPPRPICPDNLINPDSGKCNDGDPNTRHAFGNAQYDTDDYARDWADTLANPDYVGSLIFSIGLGNVSPPLLNYIAEKGLTTSYYQATPENLQKIFLTIANKIATRLIK